MSSNIGSVLVYGAAGAQGSAIVRAALAAGAKVRVLLRDGTANPFGDAVEVARGDLLDAASLNRASAGIDKVALTLPQAPDRELLRQSGHNVIDAAKAAGAKLLVWNTTGPLPATHTGSAAIDAGVDTAAYLRASGLASILIQPTLYMDNLSAPWIAPAIVHQGVLAYPLPGEFRTAWISWADLGAYVVAALQRPALAGRAFSVGGPDILSGHDAAKTIAAVLGRAVSYAPVPLPAFAAGLNAAFGNAMGDEIATHYGWLQAQPTSPLAIDFRPALAELPIRPTSFSHWAGAQDWQRIASLKAA